MDIQSPRNPRLKLVRRLQKSPRARRETGLFVVEGVRLAEEALRGKAQVREVFYAPNLSPRGLALVEAYRSQGVKTWMVSSAAMRSISATETPQGVVLVVRNLELPLPRRLDFVVILDSVRDPGNLGTILRTAWAAAAQAVLLTKGCVEPFNPKVLRAAMGAHFYLPIRQADLPDIAGMVAQTRVYLAAAREGLIYTQANFGAATALLIGGEAEGVTAEARRVLRPTPVHIPMPGGAESLNAAVAAGVMLFEVVRQRMGREE